MSLREDIESRVNILDVVSRYVDVKKAGINYKALCPFHSEKSPSFVISPQKNIAHCFSCGKWGWPINFLMEIEKIEFREAIGLLAKEAWVELKIDFSKGRDEKWGDIYALYRETAAWYHRALFEKENERYLTYLTDRKISHEIIERFQLWCSTDSRSLYFFLKEKWFTPSFLLESGIFLSESRDKFFWRITFPIANSMGHVVGFTWRVLDDALPKYLNSPASTIFDKSSILYGFHLAKQTISKTGEVYVVEWQMDTIALHQAGIDNAVGISGTALTKDHIHLLKRFAKTIYLTLDADSAWVKATFASIENLLNSDMEVRIIRIPSGKDPDEFIKSWGDFTSLKKDALSPIAFYLVEWGREYDMTTITGKKKLIEKCLEFLIPIRSQIEIDMHIQEISSHLAVGKDAIYAEYKKRLQRWISHSEDWNRFSKKWETEEKWNVSFTPAELIAGYIEKYHFLDLFFQEFRYTREELSWEGNFSLLFSIISWQVQDTEDEERLKVIALSLENQHPDEDKNQIKKAFSDYIKKLHTELLIRERNLALSRIEPGTSASLETQQSFVQKAISLGLSPSILR